LMSELMQATSDAYGVQFEDGVLPRLCAYARSVAHYPTALKEFTHRNGFYFKLSQKAVQAGKSDPTPLHTKLLIETGTVTEADFKQ